MLIRFNVRNFLSFASRPDGQTEEFSMIPGKVRSKREHLYEDRKLKLLKFAAIYGANASGKSNLVKAMDFARSTVIGGLPEGISEKYCKSDVDNKNKKSYFEFEIKIDDCIYAYGFEVILSLRKFTSEWLVELIDEDNENNIFIRDIDNKIFEIGGPLKEAGLREKVENYLEDIRSDDSVLFLSMMNQNKKDLYKQYPSAKVMKKVFNWVKYQLDINYPDRPISNYSYMAKSDNVKEICRIISAFGTGITNFELVDVAPEKVLSKLPDFVRKDIVSDIEKGVKELKTSKKRKQTEIGLIMRSDKDFFILKVDRDENVECKTIQFAHNNINSLFSLEEESDGTVRLLDLLEILLAGDNKTYVVDELDRCLHPSLTYKFVETFLEEATKKNIQLIVTTHESRLMDFDLLRRDEIWFVDKKKNGETDIYSLEEYNERFDKKIDKAYLEGRYGGVPIFSTVFPVKGE
ncbi:AAA family ATPase [Butyrivibrio fibrisolvens]|uniref:AAA family ATPase n=1 Tax=Butyrivibrio fibrisolvens TaxID=831 RepID=UPI0003B638B9|nr:ATP/GTP-binding protein [Butyrivibrio fibrisolvens]